MLRLIAGELRPAAGAVRAAGVVGYLPQTIALGARRTVAELLGITAARDALHAIEVGETGEDNFAAVGDDWDIEERSRGWLDRLGLTGLGLDDPVARLSGGETIGVALTALFLRRPDVMLLDEPTSALDPISTLKIEELIDELKQDFTIVIVTHNMQQAARCADQVAFLYLGELVEVAPAAQLFTTPRQRRTQEYITGRFG